MTRRYWRRFGETRRKELRGELVGLMLCDIGPILLVNCHNFVNNRTNFLGRVMLTEFYIFGKIRLFGFDK